ncbi:MAG: cyclic nucleotide-binding domain-containing protein [Rhizobiales bacterium]|nr:cyclic nucleotide-binding domain-containing protein [Hyphomicrobiales bacterium]
MDALASYFSLTDIPGHISYVILAVSYCLTNIYWLRVTAVVALIFEIIYFSLTSSDLYAGIAWDLIFIAINGYHLALLTHDRFSLKLGKSDRQLLTSALKGLCDAQIARVLRTGTGREIDGGTRLMIEGHPVSELYFIQEGRLSVHVRGIHVAELGPGALVGEIAFLIGNVATATVTADGPVRLVAFNRERLIIACRNDEQVAAAMHRLIGHDLATKISRSDLWWARLAG